MIGDAGQRLVTVLGYLTNVSSGGTTDFQHLRTRVTPKVGRVIVFHNCYPGTVCTALHTLSAQARADLACHRIAGYQAP